MKSSAWTREQLAAIDVADRVYTRTFGQAMRAFDRENDLRAAMNAYNAIMTPANAKWKTDYKMAALIGEEPF